MQLLTIEMIGQSYMSTSRKRKRQLKSSQIPKLPQLPQSPQSPSTNFGPLHQQLTTLVESIRVEAKIVKSQVIESIEIVESPIRQEESAEDDI